MSSEAVLTEAVLSEAGPIRIHPESPYYLQFRGDPVILVASSEHYGAVVNGDFDYVSYLDALAEYGMNYTRIYPGAYFEPEGFFCEGNSLGPRHGRHVLPWAQSGEGEYPLGGSLFDLDKWNPRYFTRLRDFVGQAALRGVVVEICFYNVMYQQVWPITPLNAANNIQGVGVCGYEQVQSVDNHDLLPYQVAYVQKIVRELNEFDNVIYEIIDEPGNYGVPAEQYALWIDRMIDAVRGAEAGMPHRHLIAQQVCGMIGGPCDYSRDPRVDIATGQYVQAAIGGELGGMRLLDSIYHHGKAIELNESTYYPGNFNQKGKDAEAGSDKIAGVRAEAWEFIVGGGAAYNHLNALYSTDNSAAKGTGNELLLTSLQNLRRFMDGFQFWKMRAWYIADGFKTGLFARCIAEPGRQYAVYMHHATLVQRERYAAVPGDYQDTLKLYVRPGTYRVEWVDPATLTTLHTSTVTHLTGTFAIDSPVYRTDVAVRIVAVEGD